MAKDDDLLKEGRDAFERCADAEKDNRRTALDDIRFAREGVQWPDDITNQRQKEGRPCLTINKLPSFIRQVVNDARQNKPAIKVRPVDSGADVKTADLMSGLIRNIEYTSNADVAYDTGVECAVTGGFGYWRVVADYAYEDAFEMDLGIKRVANPFSVYGDPNSREADSSDWDEAFVTDRLTKEQYEAEYGDKDKVDWDNESWSGLAASEWLNGEGVLVAEWWSRTKEDAEINLFVDVRTGKPLTLTKEGMADEDIQMLLQMGALEFRQTRSTKVCKVKQRIMSGAEVLKETDWKGRYIPIVPVYGDEFDIEGKRYFRSLIHNAVDAQRMFNYWRTASTELVALAPKVPFIGPKNAFDTDIDRWNTANTKSHPFLEYDGQVAPQRQPMDMGVAAGALQEALNASDDIKAIVGMYDASLGARSNETSGKAINARKMEGDVSTFHFLDNMTRAIRHTGRILIDLIPHYYNTPRVIRITGEDGTQRPATINKPGPELDKKGQPVIDEQGQAIEAMHDLTAGKYDLVVSSGPSFTTRREEAAAQMTEMIRALPESAPVLGKHLAKNLDWPGADEIAEELDALSKQKLPPEVEKMVQEGKQKIGQLTEENQKLKTDTSVDGYKAHKQAEVAQKKVSDDATLAQQKFDQERDLAQQKFEFEKELARQKLANDHQLAMAKAKNDRDAAAMKTDGAIEEDGPDGKVVKSGAQVMMEAIGNLAELIVRQGVNTDKQLQMLTRVVSADTELVRDPRTGKALRGRKVMQQETMQ